MSLMFEDNNIGWDESKFTVGVDKVFLYYLVENSVKKSKNINRLSDILINKYKLKRYKKRTLMDNLRKWQKGKSRRQIPLDVFLFLCNYSNLFYNINDIRLYGARNPLKIEYPFRLSKSLAFVSELVKVEGHLRKGGIVLENTNTELTKKFRENLLNIGIGKRHIKESLHIRIQTPHEVYKKDIKLINLNENIEVNNFHERILNLKQGDKKEIVFSESNFSYDKSLKYRVFYDNKYFDVSIKVPIQNKIRCQSNLNDGRYQKVTVSLRMDIFNITLNNILNNIFKIPQGNKSKNIFIPEIIKNSPLDILKEVISAVLASESTIAVKNKFISLTSLSENYLRDFKEILLKFNITSKINKNSLSICGFYNFKKISNNFDFIIRTKCRDLDLLIDNNKLIQSPKGISKVLYLQSLNNLGGLAIPLAIRNNADRKGHSFRTYIKELLNEGHIYLFENSWPRKYKISNLGKRFLKENETYWLE